MRDQADSPWRHVVPRLRSDAVELREIEVGDAEPLFPVVTAEAVRRFYSPPPSTTADFRRFIGWARKRHAEGDHICLTVTTASGERCGLFQLRRREGELDIAEWGFCLTPALWSTGIFVEGATLVLDYAFDVLQVHRLEARVVVDNARASAALLKLGALAEGTLRQSFFRDGSHLDETLWALLRQDWARRRESLCPGGSHIISRAEQPSGRWLSDVTDEQAGRTVH